MRLRETLLSLMDATSLLEISQAREQHLRLLERSPDYSHSPLFRKPKTAFCSDMTKIYPTVTYMKRSLSLAGLAQWTECQSAY